MADQRLVKDPAGFLKYQRAHNVLVIEHTEVDRAHRGHGYAGELVRAALDQARQERRRVVVVCPYAKDWLRQHPDYAVLDYTHDHPQPTERQAPEPR